MKKPMGIATIAGTTSEYVIRKGTPTPATLPCREFESQTRNFPIRLHRIFRRKPGVHFNADVQVSRYVS